MFIINIKGDFGLDWKRVKLEVKIVNPLFSFVIYTFGMF